MKLDLIIQNARILTLDPQRPVASAIGILHGAIIGLDDELAGLEARQVVDARKRVIVPGFNDVHCHAAWYGLNLNAIDVADAESIAVVGERIAAAADSSGDWLVAVGFDPERYKPEELELTDLDALTGDQPLLIRHRSGHSAHANTEAMARAGILQKSVQVPDGGTIVLDELGNPTGLLEETAQALVQNLILPYPRETLVEALDAATSVFVSQGITSFTEAGIGYGWIGHSPIELAAYQETLEAGRLHARAQLMPTLDGLHPIAANASDGFGIGLDLGLRTGFGSDALSIGPAKVFLDGAFAGETAALTAPYSTTAEHYGRLLGEPEELAERMLAAYASGWSIAAHAIGDAAVDLAIDTFALAQSRHGRRRIPNRIEHAWLVRDDQLSRIRDLGIAVTPQSSFLAIRGEMYSAQLGERRLSQAFRARSFVDAGVLFAGSSDRPCADGSALGGMQAYVERVSSDGTVFGSPDERLSKLQALTAYTSAAAEATGLAHTKGMLKPGLLADLVLLSDSPLDVSGSELGEIDVLATLVAGVPRYLSAGMDWQ